MVLPAATTGIAAVKSIVSPEAAEFDDAEIERLLEALDSRMLKRSVALRMGYIEASSAMMAQYTAKLNRRWFLLTKRL